MRSRGWRILLAAWIVIVGICGGVAAATHTDDKADSTATDGTTSTSTVPGATDGVGAGTTDTTAVGQATSTTKKAPTNGGGTTATVDTSPPATAQRIMPDPGTYSLAVTGTTTFNGSVQQAPPTAVYKIEQLSATDQHQTGDFQLDLRWTPDSASLLKLVIGQANKTFQPAAPVLYTPFPGTVGRNWHWKVTSTDGKTTVDQQATITKTEAVTIAGKSEPAFVVHSVLTLTGDLTGTVDITSWTSPVYRVSLRQHIVLDATYLTFHVQGDTTSQLVNVHPA